MGYTITRRQLERIIQEEWSAMLAESRFKVEKKTKSEREREKIAKQRHDSMLQPELMRLARGITEFNIHHGSDGTFSGEDDATSTSSYFVDKKRSRKAGSLSDKDDAGRGKNKNSGKGRWRMKDNQPLWEKLFDSVADGRQEEISALAMELRNVVRDEFKALLGILADAEVSAAGDVSEGSAQANCWRWALNTLNSAERAKKGDLHSKEK